MSAYIIVDLVVTDPEGYAEYGKLVPATLEPYGGRFVVRGGPVQTLEGGWSPKRIVVLEFPDADRARAWWASEEYREPKAMRQRTSHAGMILVEGWTAPPDA